MGRGGRKLSSLSDKSVFKSGRGSSAGASVSAGKVNPITLAVRSRARALLRRIDSLPVPRAGTGTVLALSFIVSGWLYGSVVAGPAPFLMSGAASTVGLKATNIVLTGQVETSEQDLLDALALGSRGSLFGFDAAKARGRVLELPWVKDVAIRKLYPGRLAVGVVEKRAAAVWQHKDRLTVVDQSGELIAKFGIADLINNRFSHLPHLVGMGAPEAADEILPSVALYPAIAGRVRSYVRVAGRRWDLGLSNGLTIRLPENGLLDKLYELDELAGRDRLLEREIDVVDMRIADRVVLRLQPVAASARAELVAARLKAMKAAERKL